MNQGNSVNCIVKKDGVHEVVQAAVSSIDNDTMGFQFPERLYEGNGFTLVWMQGEPLEALTEALNGTRG